MSEKEGVEVPPSTKILKLKVDPAFPSPQFCNLATVNFDEEDGMVTFDFLVMRRNLQSDSAETPIRLISTITMTYKHFCRFKNAIGKVKTDDTNEKADQPK